MFKLIFAMVIPIIVFLYTWSFMRLLFRKKHVAAGLSAGTLAFVSLGISGVVLWRLLM